MTVPLPSPGVPADVLAAVVRRALAERGFAFDAPPAVAPGGGHAADAAGLEDLRTLPWSSIDNEESRDLDQVEVTEPLPGGATRVRVGIADVDALAPAGSAADAYAARNATSVYAGAEVFSMLPEALSAGRTSLLEGEDRAVVVVAFDVAADGAMGAATVSRAVVRNHAKLVYGEVGAWLAGGAPAPRLAAALARVPALEAQLRAQDAAARCLRAARQAAGALEFETPEARPVTRDGRVVGLATVARDRARDLIEAFMVASNIGVAAWLAARGRSGIRRVVRAPARWARIAALAAPFGAPLPDAPDPRALAAFLRARRAADPAGYPELSFAVVKLLGPGVYALDRPGADPVDAGGHFGLAADDYAHATAPNRRYADLVTQRLVKAALAGAPAPYDDEALAALAAHCTARADAARAVERTGRKAAAAVLLAPRVGAAFDAVVTGAKPTGTFVRLLDPPAEGRVVAGQQGMDVGDRVRVRLVAVDAERGFLDFAGVGAAG
jgi:exoribonuclease-2